MREEGGPQTGSCLGCLGELWSHPSQPSWREVFLTLGGYSRPTLTLGVWRPGWEASSSVPAPHPLLELHPHGHALPNRSRRVLANKRHQQAAVGGHSYPRPRAPLSLPEFRSSPRLVPPGLSGVRAPSCYGPLASPSHAALTSGNGPFISLSSLSPCDCSILSAGTPPTPTPPPGPLLGLLATPQDLTRGFKSKKGESSKERGKGARETVATRAQGPRPLLRGRGPQANGGTGTASPRAAGSGAEL